MLPFLYRFPTTGLHVQEWSATSDISLPAYSPIGALTKVERIAAILAVALVVALVPGTIPIEECRNVPAASSSGFDVSQRVCKRSALAAVLAHKVKGAVFLPPTTR
jgi:hypothetical protein